MIAQLSAGTLAALSKINLVTTAASLGYAVGDGIVALDHEYNGDRLENAIGKAVDDSGVSSFVYLNIQRPIEKWASPAAVAK